MTEAREDVRNEQELGSSRDDVIEEAAPVGGRAGGSRGYRVALVSFGELPAEVADSVDEAVEMGGGALVRTVELTPPDELVGRARALRRRGARTVQRRLSGFDRVVVYREPPPEDEADEEREAREALAEGALRRLRRPVGVEALEHRPVAGGLVRGRGDRECRQRGHLRRPAGARAAARRRPARGRFGYKDSAERALPDLSD